MAGDPYWNNVVFLSGWEGADGSTPSPEESQDARVVTYGGNAQADTAQKVFDTSSLLLDGNGDYTFVPQSNELTLGNNDFTIETWVRFSSLPGGVHQCMAANYDATGNQRSWTFMRLSTSDLFFSYSTTGADGVNVSGVWGPSVDTDYFVSVSRQGTSLYLHAGGIKVATHSIGTTTIYDSLAEITKFGIRDLGTDSPLFGWMDETRITMTGRYGSDNYTVPIEAFPRGPVTDLIIADAHHAHTADNVVLVPLVLVASAGMAEDLRVEVMTQDLRTQVLTERL